MEEDLGRRLKMSYLDAWGDKGKPPRKTRMGSQIVWEVGMEQSGKNVPVPGGITVEKCCKPSVREQLGTW